MPRARALLLAVSLLAASPAVRAQPAPAGDAPPPPSPARWVGLLGEYGPDSNRRLVLERDGRLVLRALRTGAEAALAERGGAFALAGGARVAFARGGDGAAAALDSAGVRLARRPLGPASGAQLRVTPVRPVAELRAQALAARPPAEAGPFRAPDLVELTRLDSTVHLEVRYATADNFLGTPFYTQARAFLQRPAAEALARASRALRARGYGLLVHDGYRPWAVTRMFWDATPPALHWLVADPARGSRHNRGAAVDLTLYDRRTGRAVEMPSTYDESTARAAADYPGGTSRQRWHRALLRRAMEAEGFAVNPDEWWHFDHASWRAYGILNVPFEALPPAQDHGPTPAPEPGLTVWPTRAWVVGARPHVPAGTPGSPVTGFAGPGECVGDSITSALLGGLGGAATGGVLLLFSGRLTFVGRYGVATGAAAGAVIGVLAARASPSCSDRPVRDGPLAIAHGRA